jgi:PII-like signaling protein
MRVLDGEQRMVRIFIGESDKWHHQPLSRALIGRLRQEGFAGATLFRAMAGFGAKSILHTADLLRLSEDLPLVIEVVDTEEQIQRLIPIVDEMVPEGLVTIETVRVIKYAPRGQRATPSASG